MPDDFTLSIRDYLIRQKGIGHGRVLGAHMQEIPKSEWPIMPECGKLPRRIWLSRDYLAQLYADKCESAFCGSYLRLSVNKTKRNGSDWRDGITWDELQRIKNECLGPEVWCAEAYPAESELVNVASIRHLYVLDKKPEWALLS